MPRPFRACGAPPPPLLLLFSLATLLPLSSAVFVTFQNCLPSSTINSNHPRRLQFTPLFVDAVFGTQLSSHALNFTVYGNVSGQQYTEDLPPPDSPSWSDPSQINGKIVDVGSSGNLSTLTSNYQVASFQPYFGVTRFCGALDNGTCPLGPSFDASAANPQPSQLSSFSFGHAFNSSYAFATFAFESTVISGDTDFGNLFCMTTQITPDLGRTIRGLLTWLPAAILIVKGLATLTAAIWSPWGSTDIFRWSSNYGRDEDLLRLVTPGFGDCLQYIQFIVLTGSLTLQYPGFYQPAVSQASWSALLFNESFVSHGNGTQSLSDGIYHTNATYGMTRMSQLIGMSSANDIWACMAIWLLVIAGSVVLLCQLGFVGRWVYRKITNTSEEDLRKKNLPFTVGNMIRLLFNYFILPVVALSLFQLVIAPRAPVSVLACAVVLLVIMILSAGWILRVIFTTKPRTMLFDDMPMVLLYGPLYNTYSDSAAPFALIPVAITFMRGVAIGAVQPSGIAQIIVLAICEVILILTLNGFRPFQGQTSMNLYHTVFAAVRLITVLLMIAFVPSLDVLAGNRAWVGYAILILHACVLVFGFFLNAAQTLVEVLARSLGAGGDAHSGAVRGSILNWRMLKKRQTRPDTGDHGSIMSSAAMLRGPDDGRSTAYGARSRSISGSSQQLLNRTSGFENFSGTGEPLASPDLEGENAAAFGATPGRPSMASKGDADYYRAPRPRKGTVGTIDAMSGPGNRTRSGSDFPYTDAPGQGTHTRDNSYDPSAHDSPAPVYIRDRQGSGDNNAPRTDYAVREVDQYYRGPALNPDQPTRKMKTGPADPEGPAIAAQSWFQKLFSGATSKKKDQTKGFEVVRSSRVPPGMQREAPADDVEMQDTPVVRQEPYFDSPPMAREMANGSSKRSTSPETPVTEYDGVPRPTHEQPFEFGFENTNDRSSQPPGPFRPDSETVAQSMLQPMDAYVGDMHSSYQSRPSYDTETSRYDRESSHYPEEETDNGLRYSEAPSLAPIDHLDAIDLPSRFNSTASRGMDLEPPPRNSNRASAQDPDIARSADAQNWLRAVDALSWSHNPSPVPSRQNTTSRAAGPAMQSTQPQYRPPPPTVPRRNSRRTLSQEISAAQYQPSAYHRDRDHSQDGDNDFIGANGHHRGMSDVDGRPESGFSFNVHRHRAADSITRNSFGANAAMQASMAEYFGGEQGEEDGGHEERMDSARGGGSGWI